MSTGSTGHIIPGWDDDEDRSRASGVESIPGPPEPSHAERARTLVSSQSRGALSTIGLKPAGTPFGSVVTYGLDGRGRPCFFVSTLAEHTRNLDADARASLLVVEETPGGSDPLAAGRLTLLGEAHEVIDTDQRASARAGYLAANPGAFYVDYGDFRCLRLEVVALRYVGGFGRMSWVDPISYSSAEPDPLAPAAAAIIAHMNADHADALVTLCHYKRGRSDLLRASMTTVDRYGFEVVAELDGDRREALRVGFPGPQIDADGVRQAFIAMLAEARLR